MAARTSRGRQRIEMVKIQNKSSLEVTFSKRRAGLFKKASMLSTLCGADVAIIVFSPAGNKVFSFGHPTVEAVVERFLGENNPELVNETGGGALATEQIIEAQRNARVQELNMELTRLEAIFELEKKRGEAIDGVVEANREAHGWMRGSYDDISFEQLVTLKSGMENLMKEIQQKAHDQLMAVHGNGTPFNPYASGVFSNGNMVSGDPTSEFNFETSGGAPGAHPSTSGGTAATSAFPGSSSMASGNNAGSPWAAGTSSDACEAHGWMRGSYDDLSYEQLVTLKIGMENLMNEIQQKAHHQLMAVHGNGTPFNTYAGGVFPSRNMAAGDPTSEFNFGTSGGTTGALPFTGGVVASPSPLQLSLVLASSMASGNNAVSPWAADTRHACGNFGVGRAFF
nr:agamous-like MADS-box protein AGL62 [Ipomoea batatas]